MAILKVTGEANQMKKTIIALAITGSLAITGVVAVAAQNSNKEDILSSKEISKIALSYVKGKVYKVELDHEKVGPVYEVDINGTKAAYELKLDAQTGELLKKSTKYMTSTQVGKKMISVEEAKKIALNSVKGKIGQAKLDREDAVYEIEVMKGKFEYEVDINAFTGKIVKIDKELVKNGKLISLKKAKQIALNSIDGVVKKAQYNQSNGVYEIFVVKNSKTYRLNINGYTGQIMSQQGKNGSVSNGGNVIGLEKAKQIALNAIGGSIVTANLDSEDGVYEVVVSNGGFYYDLEIDAQTGEIIKQEKESTSQAFTSNGTGMIGIEKAKAIALSQLKGTISSANYDQDDGIYEITINANGYDHEFDINAQTGAILKQDKELAESTTGDSPIISSQKASEIALSKANGTVTKIDLEDGVYDVEVKDGTYDYEIEIDAKTGNVLSVDKEYDD